MHISKKLATLDDYLDQFISENFCKLEDRIEIKTYLINFISHDENVNYYLKKENDILITYIKKACFKYAELVDIYKKRYFNELDHGALPKKFITYTLDSFCQNIEYYLDKLLNLDPRQDFTLLKKIVKKSLPPEKLKTLFSSDALILLHAQFFLAYSPYDVRILNELEKIIEEFLKIKFSELVYAIFDKDLPRKIIAAGGMAQETLFLIQRSESLLSTTNFASFRSTQQHKTIYNFLELLWQQLKNLLFNNKTHYNQSTTFFFQNQSNSNRTPDHPYTNPAPLIFSEFI